MVRMAGETFEGVVTFLDEIKAWECVLHCPTSPAISKKQAGQVLEELEPLRLPFQVQSFDFSNNKTSAIVR